MPDPSEEIFDYTPVPEEFHSFLTGRPFERCSACDRYLLEDGTPYLIEKAYDRTEVAFEYALCIPCQGNLIKELSEGSLRVIEHYIDERLKKNRKSALIKNHGLDHRPWISDCALCHASWNASRWMQLVGVCDGPDLLFLDTAPILLCGDEIEAIYRRLSKKTKDRLGDFFDDVLGRPTDAVDFPLIV